MFKQRFTLTKKINPNSLRIRFHCVVFFSSQVPTQGLEALLAICGELFYNLLINVFSVFF